MLSQGCYQWGLGEGEGLPVYFEVELTGLSNGMDEENGERKAGRNNDAQSLARKPRMGVPIKTLI